MNLSYYSINLLFAFILYRCQGQSCSLEQKLNDDCYYKGDNECDAPTHCYEGTDCFDCDPCKQHADCGTCTSNDCLWCLKDGLCTSSPAFLPDSEGTEFACSNADFSAFCLNYPFTDPGVGRQAWVFDQINVLPVWKDGITGAGIHLRVNDDGVDSEHPDFAKHFDVASSCPGKYYPENLEWDTHGTSVASIAAASGNDGSCSVGVAPDVILSSCFFFSNPETLFEPAPGGKDIDITNNSYGVDACTKKEEYNQRLLEGACPFSGEDNPCQKADCDGEDWGQVIETPECRSTVGSYCAESFSSDVNACISYLDLFVEKCEYNGNNAESYIKKSITEGRGGKGTIHVFAAGNAFDIGANVNFEGELNSRFTISVGATTRYGRHAYYSSSGVALFISAPGSDHYTSKPGGGCVDAGVGTSWASPVVAGVAALVLEANSDLGWRDVQGIFATTSQKFQPDDSTWVTNAAGLHHSTLYGFGVVDAKAAVDAAKTWTNYSPERMLSAESGEVNIVVNDFPAPEVSSKLTIANPDGIIAESVEVLITLDHPSRGDLDIMLTSPTGTKSLLVPGNRPETSRVSGWRLLTVRAWGEDPSGEWSLSLKDISEGYHKDCVDKSWYYEMVDCKDLEEHNICAGGGPGSNIASLDVDEQTSAIESCCACGGGNLASASLNLLSSWTLVVYGHDGISAPTESPTAPPTEAPTANPTAAPTEAPTANPTTVPTKAPTIAPISDPPVVPPTDSPTDAPTDVPTDAPTEGSAPVTISPADAGGTNAPTEVAPVFCFSAYTTVEMEDGRSAQMKDLHLGDRVLAANGKYEPIYSFGHFDTSVVKAEFLQIQTSTSSGGLEITPGHLIFTQRNEAVPASTIQIGDEVMMASGEIGSVVSIRIVKRTGIFAPFTSSGTIVTNGILSSSFATIQQESRYVSLGGGFEMPLTYHQLGVIFESPHRLVCHWWGLDGCARYEHYDEEGTSQWVKMPMFGFQWLLKQNIAVSGILFFVAFTLLCMVNVMEMLAMNPIHAICFMVAFVAVRRRTVKKVV